jgi:two-component system sensor kinase
VPTTAGFEDIYATALTRFLKHEEEKALFIISDLSKEMIRARSGPEILLDIHSKAFKEIVLNEPAASIGAMAVRANELLLNGMMAFAVNYQQMNDFLEQKERRLEEANRELEAFAYSVSHDLRAPLRAVEGFSRILLEDCRDRLDEESRRCALVIRNETEKMGKLIEALLELSRMGRQEMNLTDIDMSGLAKSVFEGIKETAPGREVFFRIGDLPHARGDRVLLRQVFENLIGNAVKFSQRRQQAVIEVGGHSGAGEDVFYVKDNGAGFDMKYSEKLFGTFQRLHSEDEFDGTGVGLAIVKRIIERHNGRVWARGKVNEGATFCFTLPACPRAPFLEMTVA